MSTSSTDSPDDLKKAPISKTPEEIALDQKFDAFFTTDLELITRTIQADRQYRDKIDPQVILRVNEQAHTLKWDDFWYYVVDLEPHEYNMNMMYCNIFYKNKRIHQLLKQDPQSLKDTDILYFGQWLMSIYRINAQREGLFYKDDLYPNPEPQP